MELQSGMNTPTESNKKKWPRRLLGLSLGLLLLVGALGIAAWYYLRSDRFNRYVADKIEQGARDYGLRVKVGGFDYTWSVKTARLRDLEIVNQQTGQRIATIKQAVLGTEIPDLFALTLQRNVILKDLQLSGVELHVDIDAQGRHNFEGVRQPETRSENIKVDSSQLRIALRDSQFSYNDQKHLYTTTLEGLQARVEPVATTPNLQSPISNFKAQITSNGGSISYEARAARLNELTATATLNASGAQIESLQVNSQLGAVKASGKLEEWKDLRYAFDVETRADLHEALRVFAPAVDWKGAVNAKGQIAGTTGDAARFAFKGNADMPDLLVAPARLRNVTASGVNLSVQNSAAHYTADRVRAETVLADVVKLGNMATTGVKGEFKDKRTALTAQTATAARLEWPDGEAHDGVLRNVNFNLKERRFTVDGAASIAGGRAHSIEFGPATAQAEADNDIVTLNNINASALGGTATAEATVALTRNGLTRIKGNFAGLPTSNLLALSTVKAEQVPVSGTVKGDADISFVNSAPQKLSGTIRANFDGKGAASMDALAVNGTVLVQADNGVFNLQQAQFNTDVTKLNASGRLAVESNSDLAVAVTTTDASQLLTIAKAFPDAAQFIKDYEPLLTGDLQFNGRITGKLDASVIEGDLNASSVGMRDALLGVLTGKLYLGPNELRFQNGLLSASNGGSLKFDLATPLDALGNNNSGKLDAVIDKLELEAILAAVGAPSAMQFVAGNVSGEAHLTGLPKAMQGSGHINLIDGKIGNQAAELAQVDFKLDGQKVLLEKLEARLLQSGLVARGELDLEKKTYQLSGAAKQIALDRLAEAFELTQAEVKGAADATFNVSGSFDRVEDLRVELSAQAANVNVNGRDSGELKLTARTDPSGRIDAELMTGLFVAAGGQPQLVKASFDVRKDGRPVVIESAVRDLDLVAVLNTFAPDLASSFKGKFNGKLRIAGPTVNASGEATADLLRGGVTFDAIELQVQGNPVTVQTPLVVALEGPQLRITPTKLTGQGIDLSLGGELGLQDTGRMAFALNGQVTLANLPPVSPELRLDGVVTINNARISGTFAEPSLSGEILLDRIGIFSPDAPAAVEEGRGRIVLSGDKATLESFKARINEGALDVNGALTFAQLRPKEWNYTLKATNVDIIYAEVRATVNGTLNLAGTPEGQLLSGRADVSDAEYTGQIDLDGLVAGRNIAPGLSRFSAPGIGRRNPGLPPINLNVRVEARDSVVIRDKEINTVGSALLTLSGPLTDPSMAGRVSADGGTVRFRGQRYEVTTATLDLLGGGATPVLNLRAEGTTSGYRVTIGFVGPVDQLDLTLASEPTLTRDEILTLIATGRTENRSIAGGGSGSLLYSGVDAAASLFSSGLTKDLERQLGIIGINRFQIDPVFRPNTNPAARATIGGQLARSLYYSFATDLASEGDRTALVEYTFSNTFSTIATYTQGGTASRGINANNDFALEIRGRKRFSLGFKPDTPTLANTDPNANANATPPPAVRPKLPLANVAVTPLTGVSLSQRTLRELLPVMTQGFSRSLARLGERRLLNYLQEKGYFFADVKARCEPVSCGGDGLQLFYDVEAGERYRLSDVRFEGVTASKVDDIAAELQSQPANLLASVPFVRNLPLVGSLKRGLTSNELIRGDVETLRRVLLDRGFRDARVTSRYAVTEENGLVLVFNVEEGPQSRVADVIIKGNTLMTDGDVLFTVPIGTDDIFSLTQAAAGTQRIKQLYAQQGYLEANAELEVIELAPDRVRLQYNVTEGTQALVSEVEVTGTTKTKLNWVRRYYDFKTGQVLTPQQIRNTQRDLYATGAFREVGLRSELLDPVTGAHRITLNLTEAKPLLFVYGAGYSTDDGARGLIELTNNNIAGTMDALTLRLRASRREQFSQLLFTDLRPFGMKLPTTVSVFYNRNGDLRPSTRRREQLADGTVQDVPDVASFGLQRFAFFVQTERRLNQRTSLRFRYNFERANLFNFEQNFPETEVTRNERAVRLGIASVGITRDTRDNLLLPTKGQLFSADHQLATTLLGGNESYNKFFINYQRFHTLARETPVLKDSTLAVAARLGVASVFKAADRNGDGVISLSEQRLPISERFFSGGATTLRGFKFETAGPQGILEPRPGTRDLPTLVPLGGDAEVLFNFELRYPLTQRLRLVPFYDVGNVFYQVKDINWARMTNTIGVGLHFNTPLGPIGVDYGFLLDPPSFVTASGAILRQPRGAIHIRFGQTF
ncbi:MAG: translocation/assembly module TamB domain-containing protein [Acidobacteria bacterium]|nr:translocation/assembly module TamB domain-containing protein [Acidobacteriota bacterium]